MAQISIEEINDKKVWEDFILSRPEANFLQSWYWGGFQKSLGSTVRRVGFYKDKRLTGVMLSIVENAKRGRYLSIPGGPIIDWKNGGVRKAFEDEIKKQAKDTGCAFVRVRPQLKSDDFSKKVFKKIGFIPAPMHLHAELTSQLDITKPAEELISNMRKSTRYEVRKGESLGIEVTATKDIKALKKFYDLQVSTSKRQKFIPFSYKFLYEQFKIFSDAGKALLFTAKLKKKILAQAFVIFYGDEAVYHYGASTEDGRRYPGAYLIQWEAIKEAKKRGIRRYNFWGVAPLEQEYHRFYRISVFKRGFGGEDFEYLHAQDFVINKIKYFFNYIVESSRKVIRGL